MIQTLKQTLETSHLKTVSSSYWNETAGKSAVIHTPTDNIHTKATILH